MNSNELIDVAINARKKSYCPYSKFAVGAALLAKNGKVYEGCNIENSGLTATNCAERTAFFKAISEGVMEFEAIAIVGGPSDKEPEELCAPCGVCRQVMMEFCEYESFKVILGSKNGVLKECTLKEILPYGFGPENLRK